MGLITGLCHELSEIGEFYINMGFKMEYKMDLNNISPFIKTV